jgi:hypothetical protein
MPPSQASADQGVSRGVLSMLTRRDAVAVLDRDFLEARCKLLEIAAILDRVDRAPARHGEHPDPRLGQIRQAIEALGEPGPGRAEAIQRIFSLDYDPDWRKRMEMQTPPEASPASR